MTDHAGLLRVPALRLERRVPGPIENVWRCISDPARLRGWFGEGSTIELTLGGRVHLMDGHIRGVIIRCEPPHRLTYSWNVFEPGQSVSPYPESYLSQTLRPDGADVSVTLDHLPVLDRFEKQNAMGWHTYLDMLEATLRGGPVESRAAYMKRNAARYGVDLANLVK